LYHEYLISIGVADECIIELALDEAINARYRNPLELDKYVRERVADKSKQYYVFLDEIQKVSEIQNPYVDDEAAKIGFVDVLLGLMKIKNLDLYVTGSNSHMLSSDILTEFKDRGDEIRVNPLTYSEFYSVYEGDKGHAWRDYCTYGGMPLVVTKSTHEEKSKYLKDLFAKTYLTDVLERHTIRNEEDVLEDLLNIVSSAVGSLTNPTKISNTFQTVKRMTVNPSTISRYLDYFIDAFIMYKAQRYDIKGRKYIDTPLKYYFTDVGLRNARLNFRQQEPTHIMENIVYNELLVRGYNVDVGMVEAYAKNNAGKTIRKQLEVDFVVNQGSQRYYIQVAYDMTSEEKQTQELASLRNIPDSFKKMIIVNGTKKPWRNEEGFVIMGMKYFLLHIDSLEF